MAEITEQMVATTMRKRINSNGFEPEEVQVVQKSNAAWICYVNFGDSDGWRQAVVTRAEVEADEV